MSIIWWREPFASTLKLKQMRHAGFVSVKYDIGQLRVLGLDTKPFDICHIDSCYTHKMIQNVFVNFKEKKKRATSASCTKSVPVFVARRLYPAYRHLCKCHKIFHPINQIITRLEGKKTASEICITKSQWVRTVIRPTFHLYIYCYLLILFCRLMNDDEWERERGSGRAIPDARGAVNNSALARA